MATALLAKGFWPTIIRPKGETYKDPGGGDKIAEGKEPYMKGWGSDRITPEAINREYRTKPGRGVGVCLGPGRGPGGSWLADFEGDGPQAGESLLRLLGGEVIATMAWGAVRGSHNAFTVDGERLLALLAKCGAVEGKGHKRGVFKLAALPDLEIRIGGPKADGTVKQVQSVVPPTPGTNDKPRTWTNGPEALAALPEGAYALLEGLAEQRVEEHVDGHQDGNGNGKPAGDEAAGFRIRTAPGVEERARAYIRRIDPAISGQGGHDKTFYTACKIGPGFGLPRELALRILAEEYNPRCEPPWSQPELEHKVDDAYASESRRGWLLDDGRPRGGKAHSPGLDGQLAHKHQTDIGNAERLAARYGNRIRYCHPWSKWLVWDGKRWAPDQSGAVRRLAKRTVRRIAHEAAAIDDKDRRKALFSWGLKSESRDKVSAMVDLAASEDGIPVLPEQLDANRWLLNVQNGTIDLKTGKLLGHRREDMLTTISPIAFDPSMQCPVWLQVLERVFDENPGLIRFWQRLCGVALTGDVGEQILPILYGTGANGKTTLLTVLLEALGPDYAVMAPPGLLMVKRGESHPTERAILFGKRLVVDVESAEGAKLNENFVKQLTGSDKITARRMREDYWQFYPTHKVMLCTNHKPVIEETKNAIWRRIKLIPFAVSIPEAEQLKDLPRQLRAEYPGILAWFVQGCLDWQREGLAVPEEVADATKEYRSQQDVLGGFIEQECVQLAAARAKATPLFDRYRKWTERTGEKPLTQRAFGMSMTERGFKRITNNGTYYEGIGLRENQEPSEPEDCDY